MIGWIYAVSELEQNKDKRTDENFSSVLSLWKKGQPIGWSFFHGYGKMESGDGKMLAEESGQEGTGNRGYAKPGAGESSTAKDRHRGGLQAELCHGGLFSLKMQRQRDGTSRFPSTRPIGSCMRRSAFPSYGVESRLIKTRCFPRKYRISPAAGYTDRDVPPTTSRSACSID